MSLGPASCMIGPWRSVLITPPPTASLPRPFCLRPSQTPPSQSGCSSGLLMASRFWAVCPPTPFTSPSSHTLMILATLAFWSALNTVHPFLSRPVCTGIVPPVQGPGAGVPGYRGKMPAADTLPCCPPPSEGAVPFLPPHHPQWAVFDRG